MAAPNFASMQEELLQLRREKEFYKQELTLQKKIFEIQKGENEFKLVTKVRRLESLLEEAYKDKMKFQIMVDDMEREKEMIKLKGRFEKEDREEKISELDEEVETCHRHIESLEKDLKKTKKELESKTTRIDTFERYMSQRVGERMKLIKRNEELEERLQKMDIKTEVFERIEKENEFLRKQNSILNNKVMCLLVPEGPSSGNRCCGADSWSDDHDEKEEVNSEAVDKDGHYSGDDRAEFGHNESPRNWIDYFF